MQRVFLLHVRPLTLCRRSGGCPSSLLSRPEKHTEVLTCQTGGTELVLWLGICLVDGEKKEATAEDRGANLHNRARGHCAGVLPKNALLCAAPGACPWFPEPGFVSVGERFASGEGGGREDIGPHAPGATQHLARERKLDVEHESFARCSPTLTIFGYLCVRPVFL